MPAPGETDLDSMLDALSVERRPGEYTFVAVDVVTDEMAATARASVDEGDTTTLVVTLDDAARLDLPVVVRMAWLTLGVQSSLEAVGLTAAFSRLLADAGISCNVLAGYHHDHVLVPADRADEAVAILNRAR